MQKLPCFSQLFLMCFLELSVNVLFTKVIRILVHVSHNLIFVLIEIFLYFFVCSFLLLSCSRLPNCLQCSNHVSSISSG